MIYSTACEYAIRALTVLAFEPSDEWVLRTTIAEAGDLPAPFMGKILKDLVRAGLLASVRGRGGGYRLARGADEIRLIDIRAAIDGTGDLDSCAVGLDPCSDETPCPLHDDFRRVRETIREYLVTTTLAQVASGRRRKTELLTGDDDLHGPSSS
ncbi:MAG: Rrf2 family transcriptional regulator [Gemmatimonadota bacterium]